MPSDKFQSFPSVTNQGLLLSHLETLPICMDTIKTYGTALVLTADAPEAKRLVSAWQFFKPQQKVLYFPDWELLPYERFSPHHELISERLLVLWQLLNQQVDVIITPVATAMQRLPPVSFIMGSTVDLKVGQTLNLSLFRENLVENGYHHVNQVLSPREFSIRGGLVDLFPMGSEEPYRIELFDEEIESIHTFNPLNQRTVERVVAIRLLPAYEFPTDTKSVGLFKKQLLRDRPIETKQSVIYQNVSKGIFGNGIEFYFPLFFEQEPSTLLDYLPSQTLIIQSPTVLKAAHLFAAEVQSRFKLASTDKAYPPLLPKQLYLDTNELEKCLSSFSHLVLEFQMKQSTQLPNVSVDRKLADPLSSLKKFIQAYSGRVLLLADSLGRSEIIFYLLQQNGLEVERLQNWDQFLKSEVSLAMVVAPEFNRGFILSELQVALITESDLYQNNSRRIHKKGKYQHLNHGNFIDLAEINVGDLVVHEQHGIGLYKGLIHLEVDECIEEFMLLEYQHEAQLYVPVSQLNLISRYSGQRIETVVLHTLGEAQWKRQKQKAMKKAYDTAAHLLDLYARRQLENGVAYPIDQVNYELFVDGFEYEETEDQAKAIEEVLKDLASQKPMDRLVCGDVGFGKTEVALRAAFTVAMAGKQVALLAPTTLLVEQHTETFLSRFANFPVKIEAISRFSGARRAKEVLAALKNGEVDIVIGTHKLLQPEVQFKDLGLLIIDEEHRFGVRQKEELKKYRVRVDVLTMTATPIPRTLCMALENLRDFSLISTAPEKRLAVKTLLQPFSEAVIQEAILRELRRDGQVFFLHNDVSTIETMREQLNTLLPQVRICVAHGQMQEKELEQVMRSFLRHEYDLMICSTIIETGIDIPNANTILINRADKFGIAQLHQLRGRVGRSYHQAYAYLLTPEFISSEAQKRLEAIQKANDLGAGFLLAMQDLEIRGSGEILGDEQSGEIIKVGLNLYGDMLHRAVKALREGKKLDINEPLGISTEIKLYQPVLLPEEYCPDIHERLILYKRLAQAENQKQLDELLEELIDRFGLLPLPAKLLWNSHHLRLMAQEIGVRSIDATEEQISLWFKDNATVDGKKLIELIQANPKLFTLKGGQRLIMHIKEEQVENRVKVIEELLLKLR
ncbi:MAG: transcription-repair coupling factor [Neisseriaceae bacterium]